VIKYDIFVSFFILENYIAITYYIASFVNIMSDKKNKFLLNLLYNDPHKLVDELQPFIRRMVLFFIANGYIKYTQLDDVVQSVNLQLLSGKLDKMRLQYNHSTQFLTYFTKINKNICLGLIRKAKAKNKLETVRLNESFDVPEANPGSLNELIIQEEIKRLDYYIRLHFKDRPKLDVCLRAFARYPLNVQEIEKILGCTLDDEFSDFELFFNEQYKSATDKDVLFVLNRIFNHLQGKNNSPDSIRKWIHSRVEGLINSLNEKSYLNSGSCYTMDSFKILLSKYFEWLFEKEKN